MNTVDLVLAKIEELARAEKHGGDGRALRLVQRYAPMVRAELADQVGGAMPPLVAEVMTELARATAKFPTWPTDPLHAVAVIGEESGELTRAVLQAVYEPHKSTPADVREEAVQTAAMALRFLGSMERYEFQGCAQHRQERASA